MKLKMIKKLKLFNRQLLTYPNVLVLCIGIVLNKKALSKDPIQYMYSTIKFIDMPLPSVLNGAKQCQVKCKRTGMRCKNPAAFDCSCCRMHGAHKSRNVLRDVGHYKFKNKGESRQERNKRSKLSAKLLYLRDIGDYINMFNGTKTRGRRPKSYCRLNLSDETQLAIAIIKTLED